MGNFHWSLIILLLLNFKEKLHLDVLRVGLITVIALVIIGIYIFSMSFNQTKKYFLCWQYPTLIQKCLNLFELSILKIIQK